MIWWLRLWPTFLSAGLIVAALVGPAFRGAAVRDALKEARPLPEPHPPSVRPHAAPQPPRPMGGIVSGVPAGWGRPTEDRRVLHHSDLEVVHQVNPPFPQAAIDADLPDARCLVKVFIGTDGVPTEVVVENCAAPFAASSERALMQWRWAPPLVDGVPVLAQTTIALSFALSRSQPESLR